MHTEKGKLIRSWNSLIQHVSSAHPVPGNQMANSVPTSIGLSLIGRMTVMQIWVSVGKKMKRGEGWRLQGWRMWVLRVGRAREDTLRKCTGTGRQRNDPGWEKMKPKWAWLVGRLGRRPGRKAEAERNRGGRAGACRLWSTWGSTPSAAEGQRLRAFCAEEGCDLISPLSKLLWSFWRKDWHLAWVKAVEVVPGREGTGLTEEGHSGSGFQGNYQGGVKIKQHEVQMAEDGLNYLNLVLSVLFSLA